MRGGALSKDFIIIHSKRAPTSKEQNTHIKISLTALFSKVRVKIFRPLAEVKLLMFSKENSS